MRSPASRRTTPARWRPATPYARRHRLRRHDGEYRWVETRPRRCATPTATIVQWNVICLDIDDRGPAQEDADDWRRTRLARASQAASLAELSASIAHEVNQPLAAIVANSHACQRWLAAEPPNLERAQTDGRTHHPRREFGRRCRRPGPRLVPPDATARRPLRGSTLFIRDAADHGREKRRGVACASTSMSSLTFRRRTGSGPTPAGPRQPDPQRHRGDGACSARGFCASDTSRRRRFRQDRGPGHRHGSSVRPIGSSKPFFTTKAQRDGHGVGDLRDRSSRPMAGDCGQRTTRTAGRHSSSPCLSKRKPIMTVDDAIVFIVDDDDALREALGELLASHGCAISRIRLGRRLYRLEQAGSPSLPHSRCRAARHQRPRAAEADRAGTTIRRSSSSRAMATFRLRCARSSTAPSTS